ncbi:proline-rich protein 11 [Lingula anatina]|uniref:Proline-rich protein 11 n=1 Tax=Lingula anatina TaxID=7574 RepID=A0A1S3JP77_LINAN|nr:proline-rich protein 11 [Lingula anatina]|eukprot:XP_013412163.1 proline-rich protein 11 [Lingula anatina]
MTQSRKLVIKKSGQADKLQESRDTERPKVTSAELKQVKLRKVSNPTHGADKLPVSKGGALVTLSDLKNISLRKTNLKGNTSQPEVEKRLPQEIIGIHGRLRKVRINRSPGGTPIVDHQKRLETGSGVTPVLTRALRRKFLYARSPSPKNNEPNSQENSPNGFSDAVTKNIKGSGGKKKAEQMDLVEKRPLLPRENQSDVPIPSPPRKRRSLTTVGHSSSLVTSESFGK